MNIDAALVRGLIADQFPQWSHQPITPVEPNGWDNRTFRLGAEMSVRLPSAPGYVAQVAKEQRWLPRLAPHLPLPIPVPLAQGRPAPAYPWPWSVYRWLEGDTAAIDRIADLTGLAVMLAHFLASLQRIDCADGPPAGEHSFYRGGPLAVYDLETRAAIAALEGRSDTAIDTAAATATWEAALAATWEGPPVWVHGDVAAGNLLVKDGELSAVIDFGCCAVGDPACDMVIAWTLLDAESRSAFRSTLGVDDGTWARGQGWALWKALILLAGQTETNALEAATPRRVIQELLG